MRLRASLAASAAALALIGWQPVWGAGLNAGAGGDAAVRDAVPAAPVQAPSAETSMPVTYPQTRRDDVVETLCLAVRGALEGYAGHYAVMSFDPRVSRWFEHYAPHIVRGLVVTEENARTLTGRLRRHLALWHARPDFLAYDIRDLPSRFPAAQRKRGLPLLSWTVKSPELAERAARYVDAPIAEGAGVR